MAQGGWGQDSALATLSTGFLGYSQSWGPSTCSKMQMGEEESERGLCLVTEEVHCALLQKSNAPTGWAGGFPHEKSFLFGNLSVSDSVCSSEQLTSLERRGVETKERRQRSQRSGHPPLCVLAEETP